MAVMIRNRKSGFTLVEIIAAITVITVIAVGFLGSTIYVKRGSAVMQQKLIASQLIDKKLSLIKVDDGKSLALGTTSENLLELRNGVLVISVTKAQPENIDNLKQVVATVRWDFPWRDQAGPCNTIGDTLCDKQESVAAIFYSGY